MKKSLVIGVIFLFLFLAFTSISIGNDVKLVERKDVNENEAVFEKITENRRDIFKEFMIQNTDVESIKFMRTFGGYDYEEASCIQKTLDGGYIITGFTQSFGIHYTNLWLIKLDSNGDLVWDKIFGKSFKNSAGFVQQTYDGGYILTGLTGNIGGTWVDLWLIKTDSQGNKIWDRTWAGPEFESGSSVQQTNDQGYIIAGSTDSYGAGVDDMWLIKTDENGKEIWNKTFGGSKADYGNSVLQSSDGGYVICGSTSSFGGTGHDVRLIKTDIDGNIIWNHSFGGSEWEMGEFVQQTFDGGYIIVGRTRSFGAGCYDVWLIKTDTDGNMLWNKTFGGIDDDAGYSIQQTSDSGYIVTGVTHSFGAGETDLWLIKTDEDGMEIWNKTFGGSRWDVGVSVQQELDGGFILAGRTESFGFGWADVWVIRTDENGFVSNSPDIPKISGPVFGIVGKNYSFTATTKDPDGDSLYYLFDWGDGNSSGWLGPFISDVTFKIDHIFTKKAGYRIKVIAKDSYGVISEWSDSIIVFIIKNRDSYNSLFLRFLEHLHFLKNLKFKG